MTPHTASDHAGRCHNQGSKQRGRAVPFAVMRHCAVAIALERQPGLGAIGRLSLAIIVHQEQHGVRRRVDRETGDITQFGHKIWVVGPLRLSQPMLSKVVSSSVAPCRTDANRPGHRRRNPVSRFALLWLDRERHDALGDIRDARRARLIAQQPDHVLLHEALRPASDRRLGNTSLADDRRRDAYLTGQQHNPSPPGVLLRAVAIESDGDKRLAIRRRDPDDDTGADDTGAHAPDSHVTPSRGDPKGTKPSSFIH